VTMPPEFFPLPEKEELPKTVSADFIRQLLKPNSPLLGMTICKGRFPLIPYYSPLGFLGGPEQAVILEPGGIFAAEFLKLDFGTRAGQGPEARPCLPQHIHP